MPTTYYLPYCLQLFGRYIKSVDARVYFCLSACGQRSTHNSQPILTKLGRVVRVPNSSVKFSRRENRKSTSGFMPMRRKMQCSRIGKVPKFKLLYLLNGLSYNVDIEYSGSKGQGDLRKG